MNHCLFKTKNTKGAVGNTVDYSSLTTKDPENSDKGKNNAHHDKADSRKQQLVVKLIFVNRLRRTADTDAADRGQRTIEIAREHLSFLS